MKHLFKFSLLFVFQLAHLTISGQSTYTSGNGSIHLIGPAELQQLESLPYSKWVDKNYNNYIPKFDKNILRKLENTTLTIFIGTWCGDTKLLLPKFIKLWQEAGLPTEQLQIIALHSEGKEYKRSPSRLEMDYNIHRVPTFIFERSGIEIGRIVERPVTDLAMDVSQIAAGLPAAPRYQAVSFLSKYISTIPADDLLSEIDELQKSIYRILSGPSELNTYGYVLKAAERDKAAELVVFLNTKMYPFNPNVFDSLGEFYFEKNRWKDALACFEKVLTIKKGYERTLKMIDQITIQMADQ